jgi:predicted enzyme related to lactoylglutathione lyase
VITPDIPRATQFYADVLGMGSKTSPMGDQTYTTITNVEERMIGGVMNPPMEGLPPHWNVYFNVEDVDATAARAVELGGQVVAPGFDVPDVGRMAVLSDPQGAMFNLMSGDTTDAGT